MAAIKDKELLITYWTKRCKELLQDRNNLGPEDLSFVASKISGMKDERLATCLTELIGWGTEERAELETFSAVAIELMRYSTPSTLRAAARIVELRYLIKNNGERA